MLVLPPKVHFLKIDTNDHSFVFVAFFVLLSLDFGFVFKTKTVANKTY